MFQALLAHRAPKEAGSRHSGAAVGTIHVQDPRLERLAEQFKPKKVTPIEIHVHDLCPSLEPSFPTAEIQAMKTMNVLLLIIPAFAQPAADAACQALERLMGELCLEDLAAVEKRLRHAARDKMRDLEREALEIAQHALEEQKPIWLAALSEAQRAALRGYAFVTDRPMIAVLNSGEPSAGEAPPEVLVKRAADFGMHLLALCASLEAEMAELPAEERSAFLEEYGVEEAAGARVTRAILECCDTISFFTVGEDECRAWPVPKGIAARQAAGKVHSDIERGFIRAEVVAFEDLNPLEGGLAEARKLGKLRVEGKDYGVRDGDIVHFRFNV